MYSFSNILKNKIYNKSISSFFYKLFVQCCIYACTIPHHIILTANRDNDTNYLPISKYIKKSLLFQDHTTDNKCHTPPNLLDFLMPGKKYYLTLHKYFDQLKNKQINFSQQNEHGDTPLHTAAEYNNKYIIQYGWEQGQAYQNAIKKALTIQNKISHTPLCTASYRGNLEFIKSVCDVLSLSSHEIEKLIFLAKLFKRNNVIEYFKNFIPHTNNPIQPNIDPFVQPENRGDNKSQNNHTIEMHLQKNDKLNVKHPHHQNLSEISNVENNKAIYTGKKFYICDVCGKKFTYQSHLTRHNRSHTGERPYPCDICGKKFASKSNLKTHIHCHTGKRPYECNVCGKKFSLKCNLTKHTCSHTGERSYGCEICGKKFILQSHLTRHNRSHTGERPYPCDICGKKFASKSNLKTHIHCHTGKRPYECNVCGKKFSLKCNLTKHTCSHTGERSYECEICGKKFILQSHLTRHKPSHTGERSMTSI